MSSFQSLLKLISSAACVLSVLLGGGRVVAQGDAVIELKEAQATLQASTSRIAEIEARLAKAQKQVNALAEALASANGDSQQARESYERLRIQMEGLGVAALDASSAALQDRLLTAASDILILTNQNKALTNALIELSQATLDYAKAAPPVDGAPKQQLDARLAQAEKAIAATQNEAAPAHDTALLDARVVSLKEDAGVIVFNVGARHGVHTGMPFLIYRQDKPVARALVVDVRQDVCGAVVQDQVSKDEPVKVGDSGKVDAAKS